MSTLLPTVVPSPMLVLSVAAAFVLGPAILLRRVLQNMNSHRNIRDALKLSGLGAFCGGLSAAACCVTFYVLVGSPSSPLYVGTSRNAQSFCLLLVRLALFIPVVTTVVCIQRVHQSRQYDAHKATSWRELLHKY